MGDAPTVVVRSRRDGLRRRWLLDALAAQTLAPGRILVNGSAEGAFAELDDGCRPDPRWLAELVAAAARAPGHRVLGTTVPDPWDAHPATAAVNAYRPAGVARDAPTVAAPAAIVHAARPSRRRPARRASAVGDVPTSPSAPLAAERMRIALATPWFWPEVRRGTERILHDLAVDLAALGHAPRLLTSHPGPTTRSVEDGFAIVRSRRPPAGPLERRNVQEWLTHVPLTLRELLRGDDDAVVAAYLTDAAAAVAWGRRTGRPVVYAYMGIPERHILASRRGRLALLEAATRGADAITVLSAAARDGVWRWLGVEAHVIHPGVDLDHFSPGGERAAEPTLACAADPGDGRKRVGALVAAFAQVRRQLPTARLRLMEPRDAALRRELAQPGVEFAPWGSVRELYRGAWATGLASREEAFGLVLVESLACGTPVFGRDEGGVADIVDRPEIGRRFTGEDELAAAMLETLELARDPGTAAACRARAEAFSTRAGAEAYDELLRTLKRT